MLSGKSPFESHTTKQTFRKIQKAQYIIPRYLSEEAQDLISKILTVETNDRIAIEEVLEHPFLKIEENVEGISRNLESGNLITLGQTDDEISVFLNPIPLAEEFKDGREQEEINMKDIRKSDRSKERDDVPRKDIEQSLDEIPHKLESNKNHKKIELEIKGNDTLFFYITFSRILIFLYAIENENILTVAENKSKSTPKFKHKRPSSARGRKTK